MNQENVSREWDLAVCRLQWHEDGVGVSCRHSLNGLSYIPRPVHSKERWNWEQLLPCELGWHGNRMARFCKFIYKRSRDFPLPLHQPEAQADQREIAEPPRDGKSAFALGCTFINSDFWWLVEKCVFPSLHVNAGRIIFEDEKSCNGLQRLPWSRFGFHEWHFSVAVSWRLSQGCSSTLWVTELGMAAVGSWELSHSFGEEP